MLSSGKPKRPLSLSLKIPAQVADAYPNWLLVAGLAAAAPFFAFWLYEGNLLRAMIAALSAAALVATAVTLWSYRRYATLWAVLAISVTAHCVLVLHVPNADTHFPGIALAPELVIDVLFWQFVAVRMINLLGI